MGLRDLFGSSDGRPRKIVKAEKKITNMYLQPADRQYFMDQMRQEGTELSATALLERFRCSCENTTIDRDEKELAYKMLVAMGKEAVGPVKTYLRKYDKGVNWPFKALRELLGHEELMTFLIEVLDEIGPEYVREPERKEQLILTAKEFDEDAVTRVLLQFLDDDNETIRFVAAESVITHNKDFGIQPLAERLREEDSQRILVHIAEAFVREGWELPEVAELEEFIPEGFRVTRQKKLAKG